MRTNLKKARKDAGLTQEQMAERLEISTIHYQSVERGIRNGSFELWDAIEDMFGVHQRVLRENHRGTEDSQ